MSVVSLMFGIFQIEEVKTMCDNQNERDELTTREIARLFEWLQSHGFTAEDALDCLRYMATE